MYIWAMVVAMAFIGACSRHDTRLPFAPTVTVGVPPATPGAGPIATALTLGQSRTGVVSAADPGCGIEFPPVPPEPCQRFAVSISRPGILKVTLVTPGADDLTLTVGKRIFWGTTIDVATSVEAGLTYEITVSLHSRSGSQAFELTATLEPS